MGDEDARTAAGFLAAATEDDAVRRLYDDDLAGDGFVMNLTRVWAHAPGLQDRLMALLGEATEAAGLTLRQRGILVAACASARRDSYCSVAWGARLAAEAGAEVAAGVLRGDDSGLDDAERVLARWARRITVDPGSTTADDVAELRRVGFDDGQVVALTAYVAGRIAFSTVNGALGAQPDAQYRTSAPPEVLAAVDYGRPVAGA